MAALLHLVLPLLLAVSASAQALLISIDCGASQPHRDDNGIDWVADGTYVLTGEPHTVKNASSVASAYGTLRAFTSGKKNCYTIPVKGGGKILMRAIFYYGNYDGRAAPPTFDLLFDGNAWVTVDTTAGGPLFAEAIYNVDGEATSVCVAQTKPGQFPFISAIEVRSLGLSMYPNFDSSRWLLLWNRVAFGAAVSTTRYPDDPYDRIWMRFVGVGQNVLKNQSVVDLSGVIGGDDPPEAIFQAAVGTSSLSSPVTLSTGLPSVSKEVNINLYFAEMLQRSLGDQRTVDVAVDGVVMSQGTIDIPQPGMIEFQIYNEKASANTSITIRAASTSTLPPIISAMEVFSVEDALQSTNGDDVAGLANLQELFPVLRQWGGDPCLPTPYSWEWVGCSSDAAPRITALNLGGFGLSGELSDLRPLLNSLAFAMVETIDLHNNSLSGPIPESLGYLLNLKELNLADNNFNGSLPFSLTQNSNIKLDVSGNPNLCTTAACSSAGSSPGTRTAAASPGKKKKKSNAGLVAGVTVPSVVLFFAAVGSMVYFHQKRTNAAISTSAGKPNGSGAPNGPPSHPPPATNGAEVPTATDDHRIEIAQQMGSELADLMAQQAQQQYETIRSPDMEPDRSLLGQQPQS